KTVDLIINNKKIPVKMRELTFVELLRQCYDCLENSDFENLKTKKLEVVRGANKQAVETDADVLQALEQNELPFQVIWTPIQPILTRKNRTIKNALVAMIGIGEYEDNKMWPNLESVKTQDIANFRSLFEKELKYDFVCNEKLKMQKKMSINFWMFWLWIKNLITMKNDTTL
ncbi:hypothetical protein RFI_25583, partial [Reticulomyxa filosa]